MVRAQSRRWSSPMSRTRGAAGSGGRWRSSEMALDCHMQGWHVPAEHRTPALCPSRNLRAGKGAGRDKSPGPPRPSARLSCGHRSPTPHQRRSPGDLRC